MNQQQRDSTEPAYEVVWPLGKAVVTPVDLAPAILDLNGRTVCEMWNWGFRGDQIYPILNEELRKRFPDVKIVDHQTLGNTHGPNEKDYVANFPDLLRQHGCDALISATGA